MKQIWKWEIDVKVGGEIEVPSDFRPLYVAVQDGVPCLWAEVDPQGKKMKMLVHVFGTGQPMPYARALYVGSFQLLDGAFVGHVYVGELEVSAPCRAHNNN